MTDLFDVSKIRQKFPALQRQVAGLPVAFFDGPAGSQVPQQVADAVSKYLTSTNANHGGLFATAEESDRVLDAAHQKVADFLGSPDPDCIVFGNNMTSLTFALSRALGQTWSSGDEIIVSRLDHDANVTPWVLAARDAGVKVHHIDVHTETGTLDLNSFQNQLSEKTKLVAVGLASNVTGSINPVAEMIEQAHAVNAMVFIDAVHFAPHDLIDVTSLDCDFLACSAYKFFGPHVGMLYGKRTHLESLAAYKLRPSTNELPGKWMTGTQNHEGIAGTAEAVEYLAEIGYQQNPAAENRREALKSAFQAITKYEHELTVQLLEGLLEIPNIRIWGITDRDQLSQRVPTISFTHENLSTTEIAETLGQQGLFVWHGNHYGLPFTEAADLEPEGTVRIGILHYNTAEEITRLLTAIQELG